MNPTLLERAERIRACVIDVMDHGVNLLEIGDAALWGFVTQERDYFQAMLGHDAADAEIVHLIRRVSPISPVDSAYMTLAEMRTMNSHPRPGRAGRPARGQPPRPTPATAHEAADAHRAREARRALTETSASRPRRDEAPHRSRLSA